MMYHSIVVNKLFIEECDIIKKYINNAPAGLKVNNQRTSLYELMKLYEKLSPSNITRYKGLGEMNPGQLSESCLHPDLNRTLIRYTVEDIRAELDKVRELQTDKSKILKYVKNLSRHELIQ